MQAAFAATEAVEPSADLLTDLHGGVLLLRSDFTSSRGGAKAAPVLLAFGSASTFLRAHMHTHPSRKYRVGFIGCGGTANHFLTGWEAMPDRAEVVALCDVVPSQIDKRREDHPEVCRNARAFTDYRDMLKQTDLDIACLCAHGDTRTEHTEACLERGLHLFIEKPVGFDAEDSRRFKYLAKVYPDQKVAVAYSLRYAHDWLSLKALLDKKVIGEPYTGQLTYCHPRAFDTAVKGVGRANPYADRAGNYIHSSQLVHDTHPWDLARFLFGDVDEVFYAHRPGTAMALLWMHSGMLCYVMGGAQPAGHDPTNTQQYAVVHGSKGSAWVVRNTHPPHDLQVLYRVEGGDIQTAPQVSDVPSSSHGAILRTGNFLDAIEGRAELICSMVDGAKTTDLLHALWFSKRTQCKVPVFEEDHSG